MLRFGRLDTSDSAMSTSMGVSEAIAMSLSLEDESSVTGVSSLSGRQASHVAHTGTCLHAPTLISNSIPFLTVAGFPQNRFFLKMSNYAEQSTTASMAKCSMKLPSQSHRWTALRRLIVQDYFSPPTVALSKLRINCAQLYHVVSVITAHNGPD